MSVKKDGVLRRRDDYFPTYQVRIQPPTLPLHEIGEIAFEENALHSIQHRQVGVLPPQDAGSRGVFDGEQLHPLPY